MFKAEIEAGAREVLTLAEARGLRVAMAESCTGGLVAAALTALAGSSRVVDRGFVTYSNTAKCEMLGVAPAVIEAFGAVSEAVARAMAEGALARSDAEVVVSITGIVGPGGGSDQKPVGLVHFGLATASGHRAHLEARFGDVGREAVRERAVCTALELLKEGLSR